jgi:hypothetical protein
MGDIRQVQADFDEIALLPPSGFDHNAYYHDVLQSQGFDNIEFRQADALTWDWPREWFDLVLHLLCTGRLRPDRKVRRTWTEHGKRDRYLTLDEVRRVCLSQIPGAVVRRHL